MSERVQALEALRQEIDWMLGGIGATDSLTISAAILMRWRQGRCDFCSASLAPVEPTREPLTGAELLGRFRPVEPTPEPPKGKPVPNLMQALKDSLKPEGDR